MTGRLARWPDYYDLVATRVEATVGGSGNERHMLLKAESGWVRCGVWYGFLADPDGAVIRTLIVEIVLVRKPRRATRGFEASGLIIVDELSFPELGFDAPHG